MARVFCEATSSSTRVSARIRRLDVLIVVNITFSLVILLTAMYVKRPLDFSVFPSIILIATLFRLGLNVASTRLVLRDAFAGEVIHAFGSFVVGGSLVIGLVIFMILVVIQFVVITNGAGRVAEVARGTFRM